MIFPFSSMMFWKLLLLLFFFFANISFEKTLVVHGTLIPMIYSVCLTRKPRRDEGFWVSYNSPFFKEIREVSGADDMEKRFGDAYSYTKNPRAKIFQRDISHATETWKSEVFCWKVEVWWNMRELGVWKSRVFWGLFRLFSKKTWSLWSSTRLSISTSKNDKVFRVNMSDISPESTQWFLSKGFGPKFGDSPKSAKLKGNN